jgi:hypothetical protein
LEVIKLNKDWTGNNKSTFVTLGAKGHSETEREENDFYSTDPESLIIFLKALERDKIKLHNHIWECACGMGHLSKVLEKIGYNVLSTDLYNRGYGIVDNDTDFINGKYYINTRFDGDILTNPPYKYAKEFVEKALEKIEYGNYVIMFLKIQFLEGKERRKLFDKNPPKYIYVNSSRQTCYINGDMSKKMSSATCYCWYIWEKGFNGEPIIRWI